MSDFLLFDFAVEVTIYVQHVSLWWLVIIIIISSSSCSSSSSSSSNSYLQ